MDHPLTAQNICFIGAGSIAESIVRGLLGQEYTQPEQISIVNRSNHERLTGLRQQYGVRIGESESSKHELIQAADVLVLAIKPKDAVAALTAIRDHIHKDQLIISVVAGLSISVMERLLNCQPPVVRSMPNTSSAIGFGMTGISFSGRVEARHRQLATAIFRSIGIVCPVAEHELDIVTGVSGSGPAYIYYMMEAMIDAGVRGGLTEDVARQLTLQTVVGAAQMAMTSKETPAELRRKVTSPGGTTQAALEVLGERGFSETIQLAISRAAEKSRELGETIS